MATPVIMPRQGQSVESCIITQWHKSKGESVNEGELLFSYETDKAAFDEEASVSGILLDIFHEEGEEVPVLENIAVIGSEGEETESFRPGNQKPTDKTLQDTEPETETPEEPIPTEKTEENFTSNGGKKKISPLARKMSRELGVNYENITGTGPKGRIIKADIQQAAKAGLSQKIQTHEKAERVSEIPVIEKSGDSHTEPLSNIRKIIAARMHESLQNSAQLTHHMGADARKLLQYRKEIKEAVKKGTLKTDITINDMVCYAVTRALLKHPEINAHFFNDKIKKFHKVHLGIAVDTPKGLMVPALQNADNLNIQGMAAQLRELAQSCRENTVNPDLLSSQAASFTISNLGVFGVEMFTPVLNLPQAGILGVCAITHRPADLGDGTIAFVPYIGLSLTYDHRAVDGAPASAFLKEVRDQIENLTLNLI